jgi:hypothetical protein
VKPDQLYEETPLFLRLRGVVLTERGLIVMYLLQAVAFLTVFITLMILLFALFIGLRS